MNPKITKNQIVIDGQIYTAFEMFHNGPWKVVKGDSYFSASVMERIKVKSGKNALEKWLKEKK